jgi:hypothetical protein
LIYHSFTVDLVTERNDLDFQGRELSRQLEAKEAERQRLTADVAEVSCEL